VRRGEGGRVGVGGAGYRDPGVDVGPSLQQDRHGSRLPIATGQQQGRPTILQRVEGVRKTQTETACCVEVYSRWMWHRCRPLGPTGVTRYPSYHRDWPTSGPSRRPTEGRRSQEDTDGNRVLC
jgi:hypothetical protein